MLNIYNFSTANLFKITKEVIFLAGTPRRKQKILFLLRILWERTDSNHPMTVTELSEELARHGIESERKSLYRDLEALNDAGFTVRSLRSKDTRYYLENRPLSQNDCLLLSNLLRIAPTVPRKRKPEVEKKLRTLVSLPQQRDSFANLLTVIPETAVTERIYSKVEALFEAILTGVKVRFFYQGAVLREHRIPHRFEHFQTVSPYRLVWSEGYYLVAADPEGDLVFYRVDRMEELSLTSQPAADIREVGGDLDFDLNQYIKGYFTSLEEAEHLIFRVTESFLPAAERRFPSDAVIESAADGSYLLSCDVPADDALFGWLLLHGGEIRLLWPAPLVSRLRVLSEAAMLSYPVDDEAESGINYEERGNTVDKSEKMRYNRDNK